MMPLKTIDDQKSLNDLLEKVKSYRPQADLELIKKAYSFARQAHGGQLRFNGNPFFKHPLKTAKTLVELRVDEKAIAAALLHDVCEDTQTSLKIIQKMFGKEVAFLVEGVTKLTDLKFQLGKEDYLVENLRRMILAMAKDIRVLLIKLADRLNNLETLEVLPLEKQKTIAQETLEIYAPLAQRLGMGGMKGVLEDLAFPYVYPKEHTWVKLYSRPRYREMEDYLKRVKRVVNKALDKAGVEAEIHARGKHLFSLYKKLLVKDKNLDKIYDLVAMRVIVKTVEECYTVLGIIHKMWKPLLAMVKDYIALPKPNGYRSLHTTVFCLDGRIVEFQIRTRQMHAEAENGIAAHWYYSEQKAKGKSEKELKAGFKVPLDAFSWVKRLSSWQKEIGDNSEFLEDLKIDAFSDRIFVLTPKGEVVDLPDNSTPVDFAYAIHTEIGDSCVGAKVNGKLVELSHHLQNQDIVEILTSKQQKKPKHDWLKFVVTTHAKGAVRKALKESD